jgi:glutamine synthetase
MKIADVKTWVKKHNVEFMLCSFVEMSGIPKAKIVPVTHLDMMAEGGAGFAGFAAGDVGQGPHDSDLVAIPDFDGLTILPWRKNMAWVPCNLEVEGKPWPYCPRSIMQRQLKKAKDLGFVFKTGVEPEFFLVKKQDNGAYTPADPNDNMAKPCYDLRTLSRNFDFVTTAIKYMQELGWAPYANDHEDANCQFEINWTYSDAQTTADRLVFFRYMIKILAEQQGLIATFMPKPFSHLTGNGCHFHTSIWDAKTDKELFLDKKDELGLSKLAYQFLGGLKAHAKGVTAVTAPTVNSYKRLVKKSPNSGATWAPVYITYGGSNRTQMIRIPAPGRLENRTVDGAINPYLATAVMLAAGLDGVKRNLPEGKANVLNLYDVPEAELAKAGIETLPQSLDEALDHLEADKVILEALGAEYGPYYVGVKRAEWKRYHNFVSDWETKTYLENF